MLYSRCVHRQKQAEEGKEWTLVVAEQSGNRSHLLGCGVRASKLTVHSLLFKAWPRAAETRTPIFIFMLDAKQQTDEPAQIVSSAEQTDLLVSMLVM